MHSDLGERAMTGHFRTLIRRDDREVKWKVTEWKTRGPEMGTRRSLRGWREGDLQADAREESEGSPMVPAMASREICLLVSLR